MRFSLEFSLVSKIFFVSLVKAETDLGHFRSLGFLISELQIKDMLCFFVPGKRYNVADVSAALCMSLGLIWFTLADSKVAPNFNVTGKSFKIPEQTAVIPRKN